MKHPLFTLLCIAMLLPALPLRSQTERPNILCILTDDLGYGDLSCQGAADMRTPHIDRIAAEGVTLTHFYANSTVCSPSRASLLTGRYPDHVGVPGVIRQFRNNNWGYLDPSATLLPEVLGDAGYHTAIIGKWHLGLESPNTPTERGFDLFRGFLGDMMDDYRTHLRGGENWMRHNREVIDPEGHATDLFTDWTLEYLEERSRKEEPFFLYLAYNAPHFPIQPPAEYLERVKAREPGLGEKRALNVAFIEHLDDNIGRVMGKLEETGLDRNTLVVFTSDNGGALQYAQSNGSLRGGKQDMYEGGIRVPAFVRWAGVIPPGSVSGNMGMLMDLFPTFCRVAGVQVPGAVDGISLEPTIRGADQSTGDRVVFWVRREGGRYGGKAYYAARYKGFKLLQNSPFEPEQYFLVGEDETEQHPLEKPLPEEFGMLRSRLQEHIRQSGKVPWQH